MNKLVFTVVAVLLLKIAQVATAHAGEYSAALGAGISVSPDYQGSDDYKAHGIPFVSLGWKADAAISEDDTDFQLGLHHITLKVPGVLEVGVGRRYRPERLYQFNLGMAL